MKNALIVNQERRNVASYTENKTFNIGSENIHTGSITQQLIAPNTSIHVTPKTGRFKGSVKRRLLLNDRENIKLFTSTPKRARQV